MHPHFPRDMGENFVPVVQLYTKHGVREGLQYRSLDLDNVFFRHEPSILSPDVSRFHPFITDSKHDRRPARLNHNRMLKVRRQAPVDGHGGPAIIQHPNG